MNSIGIKAGDILLGFSIGFVTYKKTNNLKNNIGRQLLIFAISWMGSRDILIALALDHFGINNLPQFKMHTKQKKDDHQTSVEMI